MHTFYVYAWYFKSTGHVFHIGKGTSNRYLDTKHSRNKYFKNIVEKYPDDVAVKKLVENITNEEACALERKYISEYKAIGECETNFHEGGCGGNTGNYDSPERHIKLSSAASLRTGKLNSNYNKHWSEEQKQAQSEKLTKAWQEHPEKFKTEAFLSNSGFKKGNVSWNTGKTYSIGKMTDEHYKNMMLADCRYQFNVIFDGKLLYSCIGRSKLVNFIEQYFNLSRTIITKLINGTWVPKFTKHLWLKPLRIEMINNDKSLNCVEKIFQENLDYALSKNV